MRAFHETLTILIATAEDIIRRPTTLPGALPPAFGELAEEVRRADIRPAEDVRTTRAAMVMVIAIEGFFASPRAETSPWLMLAGCTLPLLRTEAWLAFNQAREMRDAPGGR